MITHPRPWFTSGLMAMLLFAALHVGALSPATAADFDKGMTAYRSGDYQAALAEWRPLAELGHATAQYNLGLMYAQGMGVPHDYAMAAAWYRRAAEQGLATAQYNLGVMYELGRGVARDLVRTYVWYELAAFNGTKQSQTRRNLMETAMSAEQITQAKALARQCRDSNYQECGD